MSIQNRNPNLTRDDVLNMLSAVDNFIEELGQIYNQYNSEPAANSVAYQEQNTFPDSESAKTAHYSGMLSMESAGDHLMAFADCVAEPSKTVAPWTCVRGLLESSALAVWFLDPTIDAKTRVGRSFAFRYVGFVQQIKFYRLTQRQAEINYVQKRMIKVEQDAISLGFPQVLNRKGDMDGIAERMPNITELIGITLDHESAYRLLSGVAHGHHWAIQQVGFRVIETEDQHGQPIKALEKHLPPSFVLYVANIAVTSFAKVIWYLWRLYGWNLTEAETLLDITYDRLGYNPQLRFWH